MDIVLCTLLRQCLCKSNHSQFSSRIIALPKATKQASRRSSVDHPPILLLSEIRPCSPGTLIRALNMHSDNQVPILILHVLEADVP